MRSGWLAVFLCWASLCTAQESEIVIELSGSGSPVSSNGVSVFTKTATQLQKRFAGKTRSNVLYTLDSVSSFDGEIKAQDGTTYQLVRYGTEREPYRKFLFQAQEPQTLLAVADSVQTVLAVNQKYHINMGLAEVDFIRAYPNTPATLVTDEATAKTYHTYTVNTTLWVVFENGKLVRQFTAEKDYTAFVNEVTASNTAYRAQQGKGAKQHAQSSQKKKKKKPFKALLQGGTLHDRMYLPKVVSTGTAQQLPPLQPSTLPPGTVLIRDASGNYMNLK